MGRAIRTSIAEADLFEIWSYIADENPAAADKLLTDIDKAFALIAQYPNLGFAADHIFYMPVEDDILILRVLHAARKHEDLL
ncbi:MAG: type II toxin-antitoxin system RelE/ParE family toxin [Pirellulaceae bacterium]